MAIRLDPRARAGLFATRGNAWAAQRKYDKAIADYRRGDPDRSTLRPALTRSRAWLLATCPDRKLRDAKKAVESATRACELTEWKDAACARRPRRGLRRSGRFRVGGEVADQGRLSLDAGEPDKAERRSGVLKRVPGPEACETPNTMTGTIRSGSHPDERSPGRSSTRNVGRLTSRSASSDALRARSGSSAASLIPFLSPNVP